MKLWSSMPWVCNGTTHQCFPSEPSYCAYWAPHWHARPPAATYLLSALSQTFDEHHVVPEASEQTTKWISSTTPWYAQFGVNLVETKLSDQCWPSFPTWAPAFPEKKNWLKILKLSICSRHVAFWIKAPNGPTSNGLYRAMAMIYQLCKENDISIL